MDSMLSYGEHPELMTEEELFDYHHDPMSDSIPTFTPELRNWLFEENRNRSPEAVYRRAFEARPPAMGATKALLDELLTHYERIERHQQRQIFEVVRSQMLRMLISCNNANNIQDLAEILRQELTSGEPAPIPEWYKFSTVTMGPRKIGRCGVAVYCGRECQVADWKARHKVICKEVAEGQEKMKLVGKMMQNLSDLSLAGHGDDMDIGEAMMHGRQHPAVKQRRRDIRAEKKRPKGEAPQGPAPDFF